jgi:beta-lactamase regulating signal transducer with metallopeptidase domain
MTPTLQAIAWTLVHFCWQAAAIALLYRIAAHLTVRNSSQTRYGLALGALLIMLATALLTFAIEIAPASRASGISLAGSKMVDELQAAAAPDSSRSPVPVAGTPSVARYIPSYMFWIDAFWLMGVCCLSFRNIGGWWLIRRLGKGANDVDHFVAARRRFDALVARFNIRRPVLLRITDAVGSPVTVGAIRSLVLLPLSAFSSLGPDELEAVIAHELAHVRRADFLWNLVQTLAETLFFFHPAVWWVSNRIRQERELCCDDLVLQICPNPVVYATALFHLEEQRSRRLHLAMALDGHQPHQTLRMRIARILGEPSAFSIRTERPLSLITAVVGIVVVALSAPQVIASLRPLHLKPAVALRNQQSDSTRHHALAAMVSSEAGGPQAAAPKPPAATKQAPPESNDSDQTGSSTQTKSDHQSYIDRMEAAGYGDDLDKLISMKIQNVTPEYARAMSQLGLGKPSADELIACKIQGVSPEVIAQLKQQGLEVNSFQDAISFRLFAVTPEFVSGMKAAGFPDLSSKQLVTLRVHGITPEYARSILQQFPGATIDDIVQTRIFNINADFIASAKAHGFKDLSLKKMVQLRISGLLDDEEK